MTQEVVGSFAQWAMSECPDAVVHHYADGTTGVGFRRDEEEELHPVIDEAGFSLLALANIAA